VAPPISDVAFELLPTVSGHGRGGPALQRLAELGFELTFGLALLSVADEGAEIFAGGGVALARHLGFDERLHFIGYRDIHGSHKMSPTFPRIVSRLANLAKAMMPCHWGDTGIAEIPSSAVDSDRHHSTPKRRRALAEALRGLSDAVRKPGKHGF
jgi:hypothetical protein